MRCNVQLKALATCKMFLTASESHVNIFYTTWCGCHLTSLSSWTAFLSGSFSKHLVKSCCWLPNATLCVGAQQKAWSMRSAGTSLCSMCAGGWRRWESEAPKKPGQIWSGFKPPGNLNIIAWTTKSSQTWYLRHRRAVASTVLPQVISNLQLIQRWTSPCQCQEATREWRVSISRSPQNQDS